MAFVFSPYIWKFTSCFQFQVNLTFNDLKAQNISKVICVPNISLNYHFLAKFGILSMVFFFFFLSLNSRNSITIVPIDMKVGVWTSFG